jgi:hypothetical protein
MQKVVVEAFGKPRVAEIAHRPSRMLPVAAAVVLFGLWCAGLTLALAAAGAWRPGSEPPELRLSAARRRARPPAAVQAEPVGGRGA